MGSGKTLAASMFQKLGAHILDADQICRKLVEPGQTALQKISDKFGKDVLDELGGLDRKKLADIIFSDSNKKKELENILHPEVFNFEKLQYKTICQKDPKALVIVDAALLIESGNYKAMDKVIVVNTDEQTQINRVLARSVWSREEVVSRIKNQMPSTEKIKFADFVLENIGDEAHLSKQIDVLYSKLSLLAAENVSKTIA